MDFSYSRPPFLTKTEKFDRENLKNCSKMEVWNMKNPSSKMVKKYNQ